MAGGECGAQGVEGLLRAFLIIAPGITIRDRLRVLLPSEPDNYFETREIVPPEMLPDIRRAEIVITNYHAFQHRETLALPKVARSFLQGNAPEPIRTTETDAEMLDRACGRLLKFERVNVINDGPIIATATRWAATRRASSPGRRRRRPKRTRRPRGCGSTASRRWTASFQRAGAGVAFGRSMTSPRRLSSCAARAIRRLSLPWVVSDFSLMDAIESGIVKLPRVPVSDNLAQTGAVVFRNLWTAIGKDLPKSASGAGKLSPHDLPNLLKTALNALYSHYESVFAAWGRRASACRRCSSWCARTPPSPNWCSTGSPAGRPAARASGRASSRPSGAVPQL